MRVKKRMPILLLFFIVGCTNNKEYVGCNDDAVKKLFSTIEYGLGPVLLRSADDNQLNFVQDISGNLDSLSSLVELLININGGIDSVGNFINGCKRSEISNIIFRNSKILYLSKRISQLKKKYPKKKESDLIDLYVSIIDKEFLTKSSFFINLSDVCYADICIRLLILQNRLYILTLDKYILKN